MLEGVSQTLTLAMKIKAAMKKKGKRRAWTKCPTCGGKIIATLAGRKDHIHMGCRDNGCHTLME